jgi:hypothetical protein
MVFTTLQHQRRAQRHHAAGWSQHSAHHQRHQLGVLAQRLAGTLCPACRAREDDAQASARATLAEPSSPRSAAATSPIGQWAVDCRMTAQPYWPVRAAGGDAGPERPG